MAELELELLIKSTSDSSGVQVAQESLKGLADTANRVGGSAATAGDAGKKLGVDLRGAALPTADLTRLLLMNVGANAAVGATARSAAIGIRFLRDSAGGLALTLAGVTLGLTVLIPMISKWISGTKEAKEEHDDLRNSMLSMLDELRTYISEVPNASEAIKEYADQLQRLALDKQREEIDRLTKSIAEKEKQVKNLIAIQDIGATKDKEGNILQRQRVSVMGSVLRMAGKLSEEVALEKAQLQALNEAQERSLTIGQDLRTGLESERKARDAAKKAIEEQRRELERLRKLEEAGTRTAFAERGAKAREANEERKRHKENLDLAAKRLLQRQMEREADRKLAEAARQDKLDERADQAERLAASASFYTGFFGQNKAARIAQALADTWAAANRALAELGPIAGPVMAALMVAQGLANVQNIRKTELGFDDPVNDFLARRLGRKFAMDVLTHINAGFGGGLAAAGNRSTVQSTTINRGTTVNMGGVHGVIGSRTEFRKWLAREIQHADRIEGRVTVGR